MSASDEAGDRPRAAGTTVAKLTTEAIEGSCLCGAVRYSARGPIKALGRCHCLWCRKASGAEFATNGSVDAKTFQVLQGESELRSFESSPGQDRVFCVGCGAPLFKRNAAEPDTIRLRLGCVDSEIKEPVLAHIFVSQKMAVSELAQDIPSFEKGPVRHPA
jgi:hypothetical protein